MRIELLNSTNNENIDRFLCSVTESYESAFPGRIRGYYIEGSYADGSHVATSDIDLTVVFKGGFLSAEESEEADRLARQWEANSNIEFDIQITEERSLAEGISPNFKIGSIVIFGEDIRSNFPLVPLDVWTSDRMHSSLWRTINLCQRSTIVTYPLSYPDPDGEFYGYDRRLLCLPGGEKVNCTRDLIRLVSWSATAILAFKAGQYVTRKSDCHKVYQAYFHDEWGKLLEDIYVLCRGKWSYLLPLDPQDRRMLREICEHTLDFENHFLLIYKEFLLAELQSSYRHAKLLALEVMEKILYRDKQIEAAISVLASDEDDDIRCAARAVIPRFMVDANISR